MTAFAAAALAVSIASSVAAWAAIAVLAAALRHRLRLDRAAADAADRLVCAADHPAGRHLVSTNDLRWLYSADDRRRP